MRGHAKPRRKNHWILKLWMFIAVLPMPAAANPAGAADPGVLHTLAITGIEAPLPLVPSAPRIARNPGDIRVASSLELLDLRLFSIPQVSGFTVVAAIDLITGMVISAANSIGIQDPALEDLDLAIRESICAVGGLMLDVVDAAGSRLDPDSAPARVTREIRAWGQAYLDTIESAPSHREMGDPLSMRVECVSIRWSGSMKKLVRL